MSPPHTWKLLERNATERRIKVEYIPNLVVEDYAASRLQAALCGHTTRRGMRESKVSAQILFSALKAHWVKRQVDSILQGIDKLSSDDQEGSTQWTII